MQKGNNNPLYNIHVYVYVYVRRKLTTKIDRNQMSDSIETRFVCDLIIDYAMSMFKLSMLYDANWLINAPYIYRSFTHKHTERKKKSIDINRCWMGNYFLLVLWSFIAQSFNFSTVCVFDFLLRWPSWIDWLTGSFGWLFCAITSQSIDLFNYHK